MRKLLLSALLVLFFTGTSFGQSSTQPSGVDLEYVTWVDGDVLVRFDDHVAISFNKYHETGIGPIDAILQDLEIKEVEQLFPYAINIPDKADGFYTYNGLYVEYPTLHNIYRINFKDSLGANLFDVIEDLAGLTDFVKYAEPNYYSGIMGVTPANEPNDTLYGQQWANEAIQADTVQARMAADSTVSDTNQVIAIIDTGVDKDHEDLKNKMWVNTAELNGSPGVDDDQNGFVDDIYGWDFVNNDGNPMDDNSHGTHCAGSAAAETNNSKGIAGVSPGAKIMGVKVMQSSGYGNSGDIAQGILYAANNGASVISMSIGGAGESQVQKDALAVAYAYSFLVASAGNDGKCIGKPNPPDYKCPDGKTPKQNFPGAFSYVLGVESSAPSGGKSGFSNYDEDGPIKSEWSGLWNYEVRAPGSQIISSIPAGNTGNNGRYRFQQGTSMACPAVAGGVALLKSFQPTFTHEKVFLHLIKTQSNNIQLNTAIDFILPTEITFVSNTIVDTLGSGDDDNRADAGETIELVVKLLNTGGYNDSVWASVELDGLEDPSLVNFIDSVRFFGSVSEYATIENNVPDSLIFPFKFTFDSEIANARGIKFKIKIWTGDSTYLGDDDFEIVVQNGIEFKSSYYPGKTTLYPEKYYLISGTTLFDTLVIKPGTTVYVEGEKTINANWQIQAVGKPDSLIYISGVRGMHWYGINVLKKPRIYVTTDSSTIVDAEQNGGYTHAFSRLSYTVISDMQASFGQRQAFDNFYEVSNCIIKYGLVYSYGAGVNIRREGSNVESTDSTLSTADTTFTYKSLVPNEWLRVPRYYRFFNNVFDQTNSWNYSYGGTQIQKWSNESDSLTAGVTGKKITVSSPSWTTRVYKDIVSYDPINLLTNYEDEPKVGNNLFGNTNWAYDQNDNDNITHNVKDHNGTGNVILNYNRRWRQEPNSEKGRGWQIAQPVIDNQLVFRPTKIYLGGKSQAYFESAAYDYFDLNSLAIFSPDSLNSMINPVAHGYVVDIKIDGKSTHWIDNPYNTTTGTGITGNGTYKFTVQFNRAMDVEVTPLLTFGIREPWTQNIVADSSYWSADSTEFNAYVTINPLTQSDGINRISVRLAKDNEGFPCPTENVRFECRISSTGSLSAGFAAVGDTGKIHLDWGIPDEAIDDYLGTNMYRIDSTDLANASYVYSQMQVDSMMTDTTVQAGKWYGYYYKIVRTSLTELNESDTVWARPWQGKPSAITKSVANKTHNSVTINGKANPNYLATDVRFNYGLTSSYSTNTTWQSIGNGDDFVNKSVNLSGLTPGTTYHYRVEAKNIEGVSYGEDSTFTTKDFPNLAYSYDSTLCVGDDVSFTNQSTISNGTLSYGWEIRNSNGSLVHSSTATNPTFTMSTAGTYTVKLTASSSDAVTTTKATGLVVEATPTPSITASGATSFCQGGNVTLTGSVGYQSYSWNTGQTTSSISVASASSYTLTVGTVNGCSGSTSVNVVVNPLPVATVSTSSGAFDFCEGSSLTLEAPVGASGYQWYKDGTGISGAVSSTLSASGSGSYAVEVTSSDGCSALSASQTVVKNLNPTASISNATALSFCDGGSVVLSAPSGMSYAWSTGATTQTVTQSSSGQVGLTITDANGCASAASPVTVNVYSVPALTVTSASSTSICQGESVTLQAGGGFSSYAWSNGATNQNLIATTAGSYSVTGTTSDGCMATSAAQAVTVNAVPTATITNAGSSVLCSGDSTTLTAPSSMSSYLWSNGSTSQSITTSTAGNYTVTVTNAGGCSATSSAAAITTSSITTPSISSSGSTTLCSGSNVTLSVPTGYSSYLWSNGATTSATSVSASGSYSVTLTNADGCSTTTSATAVTVNTPPTASITSTGTGAICAGASETLSATSGMSSYQWYANGTAITGATSATYTATASGNYSVSVVDANGCSDISTNYTITNAAAPVATITNAGSSVLCSGGSATLSAPSGMSSYLWSDGSTSQSITTSTSGNYTVTVTNAGGCSATSTAAAITTSSITTPSISSSGSTTLCSGSNVTLSVPTGYSSYLWSNGATTSATSVSASGSYSVTLTNADGCSTTTTATSVTVNTPPTASITSTGTGAICSGGSETLSGPTGMTSYQWYLGGNAISGATSASLTATAAGTYSLSVVDGNGCGATSPLYTITTAANPVATIVNSGSALLCSGASTTLTAPAGMSGYTWSTGDTTQSIVVSSAGSYTVTVVNSSGCSATSAATVISASQIVAPTISVSGPLAFCAGGSVTLGLPMGYNAYGWNSGVISTQLVATQGGDYYATVTNSDGCTASSDTVSVVVFSTPPTPSISYTANDTIMISSIADGNQWYFNGNILQGETNDTLRPLNFGNYSVRVEDTNGCEGVMSAMQFYNSVGIAEDLERMIKLYPNPTSGKISLELGGLDLEVIRVIDGRGRLVREISSCDDYCQIDISEMGDGMYQLVFITSEGLFVSKSVVLQK
ncbi:S8 family serine peptidase [Schleiferiaceae bacterium]|nr:S8 family serine peptidase [Schleiferiaceae bacterium]